jgi:7,8-dihydropterin-6-yl-methyl-4-(beta-D-ribofuranosyl)aminobenzene 5'-phosphate synthase
MAEKTQSVALARRTALCGGGVVAFGTLIDALLGGRTAARAQTLGVAVPDVDRVAVRVVIDSYQIAVAPSLKSGNVEVRRFGWPLGAQPPSKALVSEFGLSMHIESRSGEAV